MDWTSVAWSALLGGLAGGLAIAVAALVRHRTRRPGAHGAVFALVFCLVYALGRTYALPAIEVAGARREADRILATDPIFSVLVTQDPELRARFQELLIGLTQQGVSSAKAEAEAFAFGRTLVGPIFQHSLPSASGESLVAYAAAMVEVLDALRGRDGAGCYAFMTGQLPKSRPIAQLLSPQDQSRMSHAMAAVLESALTAPAPPVPESQVAFRLSLLAERMRREHGEELVAALASVGLPMPAADPETMCAATVALYRTALAFPDGERETLLRCLFAPQAGI